MAWILDSAIRVPGTDRSFGVGPLIGLIPVIGDLIGGAAGIYVISRAMRVGLPRIVIVRMGANTIIDTAVGVIPIVGDVFDFVFKSNQRNLRLFEQHALDPDRSTLGSWAFVGTIVGLVVATLLAVFLVVIAVIDAFLDLFR